MRMSGGKTVSVFTASDGLRMNFFEQQDIAHRNTRWLIILFGLAVITLIAITALLFAAMFAYLQTGHSPYDIDAAPVSFGQRVLNNLDWSMLGIIAISVCTVVGLSSLFKFFQLRGGGRVIAEAMGGQLINQQTTNADERKILNIVEEMAIASGAPVPPVYLMEDDAINAFAAGHNPHNAVIGVTRGCIRLLNRDELQGVVAHEFSHIFHGDMRLNLRLVAVLHGILVLGLVGQYLFTSARYRMAFRSSKDNSPLILFGMALVLVIIGYAGTFFGNIIKAAVSRQREYLADASAVQFTRNPSGIAGALKKIRNHSQGSLLHNAHASEFSHMYFSQGVRASFTGLMATHPPLDKRISRIDKSWQPETTNNTSAQPTAAGDQRTSQFAGSAAAATASDTAQQDVASVGTASPEYLSSAQSILTTIGAPLRNATQDPFLCRGALLGLFLAKDSATRSAQWQLLEPLVQQDATGEWQSILELAAQLAPELRLPLIELALPGLKKLTDSQVTGFKKLLDDLVLADKKISLQEWSLQRIVLHHLEPVQPQFRTRNLRELRKECEILLAALAFAGHRDDQQAQAAFQAAANELRLSALTLPRRGHYALKDLDQALATLNSVAPLQKPQLLKAMSRCIQYDGKITVTERELLRAMADGLDCPMPPLASTATLTSHANALTRS